MMNSVWNGGLAYLATPFSKYPGGIEAAFVDASKLAARLMLCCMKVYSPIAHCYALSKYGNIDPHDHSIWLPFDQAMMKAADVLIVAHMEGWEESFGIAEEVKFFGAARKPIFDCDPSTLMMTRRQPSGIPSFAELKNILDKEVPQLAHGKTNSMQGGSSV